MSSLVHRRLESTALVAMIHDAPSTALRLGDEHRVSLAARFRAVNSTERCRLDAWAVETAGQPSEPFRWSASNARRAIGSAALRRVHHERTRTITSAVVDEIDELIVRAAAGYARPGSLPYWLSGLRSGARAAVTAEGVLWTTQALEVLEPLDVAWEPCASDAFYDVAAARTSLRGRRDAVVHQSGGRVLLRFRSGQPGKSAGPGLRADLVIDALSDPLGRSANRIVGLWPEAGIALAIDGTIADARAGARDLVRTAVAQQRFRRQRAA